jgi:hypothetical protein
VKSHLPEGHALNGQRHEVKLKRLRSAAVDDRCGGPQIPINGKALNFMASVFQGLIG